MKGAYKMEKEKTVISLVSTIILFLFDEIDLPLKVMLVFIVMDYITGMIKAFKLKKLSSKTGLYGLIKKFVMLLVVSFTVMLDRLTGANGLIRNLAVMYYIANEGLSILENASVIGVPIPEKLKDALLQLKEKESE